MDTNTYFYLLAFGCMVLVGCVFILYQKTKKIHDNQIQFQKQDVCISRFSIWPDV